MEVDFNNLRKSMAKSYNKLCLTLNRFLNEDGEFCETAPIEGDAFYAGDIKTEMDDLRNLIATLICIYDESQGIKVIDEKLEVFAPEPDEIDEDEDNDYDGWTER